MSNTNPPPLTNAIPEELLKAARKQVDAVRMLERGINGLSKSLSRQFAPIDNLSQSFRDSEEIQLQALQAGTTYSKFLAANTDAMKGLMSSNTSMTKFMLTGFTRGLRDVSEETMALADVMNITGEDTGALAKSFGQVRLLTGNSVDVTRNLAKTIEDTTQQSGVSRGQLIQALDSFSQNLFQASLYGEDAVGNLAELGVVLKGGLAGAPGAERAINVLLGMQNSLNIAQQEQLGLRQFFEDSRKGTLNIESALQQLRDAGERFNKQAGNNDINREALARAIGGEQVRALLMVTGMLEKDTSTAEEMRATQEDQLKSMRAFEEKKKQFFETFAPEIHSFITQYLPLIAAGQGAMQVGRLGMALPGALAAGKARNARAVLSNPQAFGAMRAALAGGASKTGARLAALRVGGSFAAGRIGASLAASLAGGPIGIGIGILSVGLPLIISAMNKTADNTEVSAKAAEKELSEKRSRLIAQQQNVTSMAEMGRSILDQAGMLAQGSASDQFFQRMEELNQQTNNMILQLTDKVRELQEGGS
tara:strand:- start:13448 stop:15055 length:1608 start_codon:yes stop_codon:yes gene_type:complete